MEMEFNVSETQSKKRNKKNFNKPITQKQIDDLNNTIGANVFQTNDADKLKVQREKFVGECPICHKPLTYINDTNILMCNNSDCKGVAEEYYVDGEKKVRRNAYFRLLGEHSSNIAKNLFAEL